MNIKNIKQHHGRVRPLILERLQEFSDVKSKGNKEVFRELCYCLLTAGTSAELGIKTIEHLGDVIFYGSEQEIAGKLKECYRFYNIRAGYIFLARQSFKYVDLNADNVREQLVKNIKGLGMKEASHFLRNIGFKEYAILDKHAVNCLFELGVIYSNKPPKNKNEYLEIEEKMKNFANKINVYFDELDLVLWSFKTGKVLK